MKPAKYPGGGRRSPHAKRLVVFALVAGVVAYAVTANKGRPATPPPKPKAKTQKSQPTPQIGEGVVGRSLDKAEFGIRELFRGNPFAEYHRKTKGGSLEARIFMRMTSANCLQTYYRREPSLQRDELVKSYYRAGVKPSAHYHSKGDKQ